jgi:hypothetical protein
MARGHPNACDYTPRQLVAFVAFYERERRRGLIERVRVARMGQATGKGAAKVDELLKTIERETD